ncbi:WD40 repeat-like protein [Cucurbitaria berberidis CBS 394.84]|uniref:ASTRA-associated protein 1 n=1 Tax=Cucurbitaria berberidis CBS 394.84 TaxID=1168544 RepID=A0A9P4GJ75_9PLEO|nr:WD40 repeat-like protein [Cucurbitaria berberidis CBS 394.84]KAF1846632.1 WD40 repeat-like protein [Cucurbitaria berberidis CBS 394.84]
MAIERQTSSLPPAQPSYILRGHASQIHSAQFVRQNSRLLTGDADGWVVYWKLETKRALALRAADEDTLSTILPTEQATEQRPKPWLLHTLPVNTLNFCAFSMCYEHRRNRQQLDKANLTDGCAPLNLSNESILTAVPARDDKKIEVYRFPDEKLKFIVPRAQSTDTGMVMAVKLVYHPTSNSILVLAGYEGGLTAVHRLPQNQSGSAIELAQLVYLSRPHTQPVLSLDASPDATKYFTSSADAIISAHRIPELTNELEEQDDLSAFEQGKITDEDQAAIVGNEPGSETPSLALQSNQPPLLAAHDGQAQEDPSAPLNFSKKPSVSSSQAQLSKPAGLSSLLSPTSPQDKYKPPPPAAPTVTIQPAYKTIDTKHAGQQSLVVRSDGRLLMTGGWDTRIRIYSAKSLKEVAQLKWHKEGVYAVGFGEMLQVQHLTREKETDDQAEEIVKRETGLGKLQRQREEQMQLKHWVVAGAKDGKASLWEVF